MIREREYGAVSGWAALGVLLAAAGFCLWQLILAIQDHRDPLIIACAIGFAPPSFSISPLLRISSIRVASMKSCAFAPRAFGVGSESMTF